MSSLLLLDTHVFLWWRSDAARLEPEAQEAIATASIVFVSAASAWEAGIKQALGRLVLPAPFASGVDASGFTRMPIAFEHAAEAASLPPHHGDPFDRMLIAQARLEGLTLVSHDRQLAAYDVAVLWT
jgi:PIN domain nuclease of toxin-antitoxin system